MDNAGYVLTGWIGTGAVLAAYTTHLFVRARRARRALGADRP